MSNLKKEKRQLRHILNRLCWPILFRSFRKVVAGGGLPSDRLLRSLVYHWGNSGWSADARYLKRLLLETLPASNLTILECGSGLTTVLLGVVADRESHRHCSLEHHPEWKSRMTAILDKYEIRNAKVLYCPLIDYGSFDWYDVSHRKLSENGGIDLVICDGPPGLTRGGRSGLLYVIGTRLNDKCVIVADDANRLGEQQTFRQWAEDYCLLPDDDRSEAHHRTFIFTSGRRPDL